MIDPAFIHGKIARVKENQRVSDEDNWAVEEPLEIRLGQSPLAITMRTPGSDDELAAGFLLTENIIRKSEDIEKIARPTRKLPNVLSVTLRRGVRFDRKRLNRYFHSSSSCGVCGKRTLEALRLTARPIASDLKIPLERLYLLPEKLRSEQETFDETGGLHAAAVFDARGELLFLREDVGRHNAVDKAIGAALLRRLIPLEDHILMVSGRVSFEIMQKALMARIPMVAAVSAPSSLAIALARKFKMTLIGFLRSRNFNIYAGEERIDHRSAHI